MSTTTGGADVTYWGGRIGMGDHWEPLDINPPVGASPSELTAYFDSRRVNEVFGEGHIQAQLAASRAEVGSIFEQELIAYHASIAQGAVQHAMLAAESQRGARGGLVPAYAVAPSHDSSPGVNDHWTPRASTQMRQLERPPSRLRQLPKRLLRVVFSLAALAALVVAWHFGEPLIGPFFNTNKQNMLVDLGALAIGLTLWSGLAFGAWCVLESVVDLFAP